MGILDSIGFGLFFSALDMQGCGISADGAQHLLDVLKYNTTLVVLDVRRNPLIGSYFLCSLLLMVKTKQKPSSSTSLCWNLADFCVDNQKMYHL